MTGQPLDYFVLKNTESSNPTGSVWGTDRKVFVLPQLSPKVFRSSRSYGLKMNFMIEHSRFVVCTLLYLQEVEGCLDPLSNLPLLPRLVGLIGSPSLHPKTKRHRVHHTTSRDWHLLGTAQLLEYGLWLP